MSNVQLITNNGQLSVGWEIKSLNDLCENLDSKRIPITKSFRDLGDIPYYGASGIVDYIADYIFDEDLLLVSEDGANLLARTYPIAFSITGKTWVNNHAHVLRFNQIITQRFVEYYLNSISLQPYVSGMAQPKLNQKALNSIPIPMPPIAEQKRIVAILDEAFEGCDRVIRNTEKNLANAREIFESYLNAIFTQKGDGWNEKRLADIAEVQSGGTPSRSKSNYWGGEMAWYSSGELNDLYTIKPERTITDEGLDNSNAKLFPKGSLLAGMYDTAALKMSILDREAAFNQAIAGVKPNEQIDLVFILHAINFVKPNILSLRRGVRQKNLSLQKIKDIVLAVPQLQEQQRVVGKLASMREDTQRLETIYRQKLSALKELKQSILQKAFTGELTADKEVA